jgi:micrococcal nuclease
MIYKKFISGKRLTTFSLAIIWILLLTQLCLCKKIPQGWEFKVSWVIDGDTFVLENRDIIRIKGIDAPELAHEKGEKSQYYAKEAKYRLKKLIYKKSIIIKKYGLKKDRFGRFLAYVYLPDGRFLNLILIREGYAFYFPHLDLEKNIARRLLDAQRTAMDQRRGFWAKILSMNAAHRPYIGNRKSKRFHTLNCVLGKKIYWKYKVRFSSLYEAFYKGYAPCRECSPWPYIK